MNARPRKVDKLLDRDGRFFARVVVPKDLRTYVGKTELRTALGPDRRMANRLLPAALADLHARLAKAEGQRAAATGKPVLFPRFPLTVKQMAERDYLTRLEFDEELRAADHHYAEAEIDWDDGRHYRDGFTGKLPDDELEKMVGDRIERFRRAGHHDAEKGTEEWRRLAQAFCLSIVESMLRQEERSGGDFTGKPSHPLLADVHDATPDEESYKPVSLLGLLDRYLKERETDGKESAARKRWTPVFTDLKKHVGHDDAARITRVEIQAWLEERATKLAPKTITDTYLASVRAVLTWAHDNDLIPANPSDRIKRRKVKKVTVREQGFTLEEAKAVLRVARDYQPAFDERLGRVREAAGTTAAKRWTPWLAAHTGARIAELTQLRKQDVRQEGGITYLRITPAAGSVKSAIYRDVPLHNELAKIGFLKFVQSMPEGPLFFKGGDRDPLAAAQMVAGRVSEWLQAEGVVPEGVKPSHGWRHRLKTVGREVGVDPRVLDSIQGHSARTAGENYGDVTLKAKQRAMKSMPSYNIN